MFVKARAVLFKFEGNGFLFRFSTAAAADPTPTHLLVNYLINSLGFSKQEAVSASAKVGYFINAFNNPDLSVNFLKQTGFKDTHIKILVSKYPKVLYYDVENNLKPKLHCLSQLGLSRSDLVKVVLRGWIYRKRGLDTHIKPLLNCLKNVLGSDENVVNVIKGSSWLICHKRCGTVEANLNSLRSFGCSNDKIKNILIKCPKIRNVNNKRLDEMLHRVEKEVAVSPDSAIFPHIVYVLTCSTEANVDTKFEIFKSFGWSDTDILTMLQKLP